MKPTDVLHLVPIYCGTRTEFLMPLSQVITRTFGLQVEQHPPQFDPEIAFDSSRGQYNSRLMLAQLLKTAPPGVTRVLGVTGFDLFIPVLTYVFGEAQLDGPAAVVSFHRLANEVYGLPPDPVRFFERLCKETIHELGHTFNLVHCHDDRCVMASSTYVEGIDLKSERFCTTCLRSLRKA